MTSGAVEIGLVWVPAVVGAQRSVFVRRCLTLAGFSEACPTRSYHQVHHSRTARRKRTSQQLVLSLTSNLVERVQKDQITTVKRLHR